MRDRYAPSPPPHLNDSEIYQATHRFAQCGSRHPEVVGELALRRETRFRAESAVQQQAAQSIIDGLPSHVPKHTGQTNILPSWADFALDIGELLE